MSATAPFRIGTRGSPLALAQAHEVQSRLAAAHADLAPAGATEIVVIATTGDRVQDRPLAAIGGKGLFTKEIDEAQLAGRIDIAVHSMKDVPTLLPDGLALAAILEREDVRDAFLSYRASALSELPAGAVVGTTSLRRAAQVLYRRPDLRVVPLRGNVQTRLSKLEAGVVDATLLAMAGLNRLRLRPPAATPLSVDDMLPAVAQGAIGVTCRADDRAARQRVAALDHAPSRQAVTAERAFLAVLDGSCQTPIAGLADIAGDGLRLRGLILRPDGSAAHAVSLSADGSSAETLGREAALELLRRAGPGFLTC